MPSGLLRMHDAAETIKRLRSVSTPVPSADRDQRRPEHPSSDHRRHETPGHRDGSRSSSSDSRRRDDGSQRCPHQEQKSQLVRPQRSSPVLVSLNASDSKSSQVLMLAVQISNLLRSYSCFLSNTVLRVVLTLASLISCLERLVSDPLHARVLEDLLLEHSDCLGVTVDFLFRCSTAQL
eukprot:TRINITY_DN30951_c0_g1_i1.p1 TRINITY_DN30951_c0_g1~~TRINITY_DN30951_c0_g1_i1.p1  ORF type:complete len:179 (-),score=1.60 TRINITY_DN30951_c0_g1_i1:191-727(-)